MDRYSFSEESVPGDYEEHFDVHPAFEHLQAEEWGNTLNEYFRFDDFVDARTVISLDSTHDGTDRTTPISRVLSVLKSLRPSRPRGLSDVHLARVRDAKRRLTRGISAGVRGIRRHLPTHVRAPLFRTTPGAVPPPARRITQARLVVPPMYASPISMMLPHGSPVECTTCQVQIALRSEGTRVSCGHVYHSECLLMLVQVAMRTPAQFPPRCCRRPISTVLFRSLLDPVQWQAFTLLQREKAASRPLYCANPKCSRFLGEQSDRTPVRIHTCSDTSCAARTCARCGALVGQHETAAAHVCTRDPEHAAVLHLGTRQGWQRCPGCEQLVERNGGCPHMTCRCGTEFCYSCGKRYSACICGQRRPTPPFAVPEPLRMPVRRPIPFPRDEYPALRAPQPLPRVRIPTMTDEMEGEGLGELDAYPRFFTAGALEPRPMRYTRISIIPEDPPWLEEYDGTPEVSLSTSSAGSAENSEAHSLGDDVGKQPVPDTPALTVQVGLTVSFESTVMSRRGELAQQARSHSLRRAQ